MLQQTRVAVVIPYYERFLERFPSVAALAEAGEAELLAAWSGLGYYARARNLRAAARQIVERGAFPDDYGLLRRLPGVGDYTAAAIASIAFDQPCVVVDGNVLRVLSRLTNDAGEIRTTATRRRLEEVARRLLDRRRPGRFNQALMELGATVCLPRQPVCSECPIARYCQARRRGTQQQRPVKSPPPAIVAQQKTLLVIERRGRLLLWQRPPASSRLAGFWELPEAEQIAGARLRASLGGFRHSITNHRYQVTVALAGLRRTPDGFQWVEIARLPALPLSTMAAKALALWRRSSGRSTEATEAADSA